MRAHHLGNLIAGDHRTGVAKAAPVSRMLADRARRAHRIGGTHVGDDPDAALQRRRHDRLHALKQHRRVAFAWILGAIERLPRDSAFGQAFHREIVKLAALDDLHAWRNAVIGKTCAAAYTDVVTRHGSAYLLLSAA